MCLDGFLVAAGYTQNLAQVVAGAGHFQMTAGIVGTSRTCQQKTLSRAAGAVQSRWKVAGDVPRSEKLLLHLKRGGMEGKGFYVFASGGQEGAQVIQACRHLTDNHDHGYWMTPLHVRSRRGGKQDDCLKAMRVCGAKLAEPQFVAQALPLSFLQLFLLLPLVVEKVHSCDW